MKMKLMMVLLGSKAPGRNIEQHDFFFGIAENLKALVPQLQAFWPEAGNSLHVDGWREVTAVDGFKVHIVPKADALNTETRRLFFMNLGGYKSGKLEEQHYTLLTVQDDRKSAIKQSTGTDFFKTASIATIKGAGAHIDEKYGIDVDDAYRIEDVLPEHDKALWHIELTPASNLPADEIHLGYFKLDRL